MEREYQALVAFHDGNKGNKGGGKGEIGGQMADKGSKGEAANVVGVGLRSRRTRLAEARKKIYQFDE